MTQHTEAKAIARPAATALDRPGQCGFAEDRQSASLRLSTIPHTLAARFIRNAHYLHSMPGATALSVGVFSQGYLVGVVTLGGGPANAFRLVAGASRDDCLALTRFCLSDEMPRNSESKVLGDVLRHLARYTPTKFVVTYAHPAAGHVGTIYQASNWIYTGLSEPSVLYELPNGSLAHSRTVAETFGTRRLKHLKQAGAAVRTVPQQPKHRYLFFLDRNWRARLLVAELPYPKKEAAA